MKIGVLTGGGDCPALNAVIRAAVKTSIGYGWEVIGIEQGFEGLVHLETRLSQPQACRESCIDVILIPEIPYDAGKVTEKIMARERLGKHFSIVVAAEGTFPKGGAPVHIEPKRPAREPRLGGIGERVAATIEELTGKETRIVVLGHLQRGGPPTTFDRVLGTRFGAAAARLVRKGAFGRMVSLIPPDVESIPIRDAIGQTKTVPLDSDILESAREIGISFGD